MPRTLPDSEKTFAPATRARIVWRILLALSLLTNVASAQDELYSRERHPWARLRPGSWKRMRDIVQTVDRSGGVTGTTTADVTTTLTASEGDTYTLCVATTVEVAGKRLNDAPRFTEYGLNGELAGVQSVQLVKAGEASLEIAGKSVPTEVREITVTGGDVHRVSSVHYSNNVAPHVLKRVTTSIAPDGKKLQYRTESEVVALDVPHKVISEVRPVSFVRTVQQLPKGVRTVSMEVHCADVPGGIVYESTTKEEGGTIVERRIREIVAFEVAPDTAEPTAAGTGTGRRRVGPRSRNR